MNKKYKYKLIKKGSRARYTDNKTDVLDMVNGGSFTPMQLKGKRYLFVSKRKWTI